ncbi:unnamed protein product [Symbiodinium natans]|uniref:Uncharacterized protein n=1 Tax=Symbiodinium natans TaxID=878477 RepID=A0A812LNZ2_9DINO|nr:unnamed protein product [Symbiodinium natans]
MVQQHERDRLWHFFCHFEGFARAVDEAEPWDPGGMSSRLKWQRLFEQNAEAEAKPGKCLFTWVQLGREEVRVALPQEEAMARVPEHQELVQRLAEQSLFSSALLQAKLTSLLSTKVVPRLRELIVGRPGPALCLAGFYQGASSTKARKVKGKGQNLRKRQTAQLFALVCRPDGWLVELWSQQCSTSSTWLQIAGKKPAAEVTVRDLCKAVSAQLPALGFRATHAWLANAQDPQRPADLEFGLALLRDLRWTQAERLLLREIVPLEHKSPADRLEQDNSAELRPQQAQPLVLLQRCSQRPVPRAARPWRLSAALAEEPRGGSRFPASLHCISRQRLARKLKLISSRVPVAHSRRLLLTSRGARQFEFHPLRPGTMLVGRKDGTAGIINYETDVMTHSCVVDQFPILGLSWFHTLPQWAVVGGSQSGVIRFLRYDEGLPGKLHSVELEPFQQLSSLSMNCTDDYFMTSGFCIDVGLYDVVTGRRIKTFRNLHQNFINILRFSHRTHVPQKKGCWQVAEMGVESELGGERIPRHDALCADRHYDSLICESVDQAPHLVCKSDSPRARLKVPRAGPRKRLGIFLSSLFSVFYNISMFSEFVSSINYRRSLYAAGGEVVATVATNESLLRLYDAAAPHRSLGVIDFRNMLLKQNHRHLAQSTGQGCFFPWASRSSRWSALSLVGSSSCEEPRVNLDQAPRVEYLQSLRCHPGEPSILGALAAASEPSPEAYVAAIHLEEHHKNVT